MKAILMAAGVGSRLAKDLDKPKCCWEVGALPLIEHTVKLLLKNNFEVCMIVGYKKEVIFEVLKDYPVKYYYNPFFRATNSLGSLYFAKDELTAGEDVILGNADVFYEQKILDLLIEDTRDAVLLGDKERVKVGDYFFQMDGEQLIGYGKDLALSQRNCEYVGLAKIGGGFVDTFKKHMLELVDREMYHLWWENILYEYCKENPVFVKDVDGNFWGEIDYIQDYNRIREYAIAQHITE